MQSATPDERAEEPLFAGRHGRIFVPVSTGWLGAQMGRQILPPLLPAIIATLSITSFQAGLALTLVAGTYALVHYPGGQLSDQLSHKSVLVGGLVVLTAGFVAIAAAESYAVLLVAGTCIGVGSGLYLIASRSLVSKLFVRKRGQAIGTQMAFGTVGSIGAAGFAALVLAVWTWRYAFVPVVVILLGTVVAIHTWDRESYEISRVSFDLRETFARILAGNHIRWLVVSSALFSFASQGAVNFLPTYLHVEKGFSEALASGVFASIFVVGIGVMPVIGRISDRLARAPVATGAVILSALGLGGLVVASSFPLLLVSILVFAVGISAFHPVMQAFLMDRIPDASMGGDFGASKTVYTGFGSLGPLYVGYVADIESYALGFAGLVVCLVASAVAVWARTPG